MPKQILVLGNSNVDIILKIPRFHDPGETILATDRITAFGGKGANQAITAKQLGGDVLLATKVGHDPYGKSYRQYFVEKGFNRKLILEDKKLPTGMAIIELTPKGENRIIASLGANGSLSRNDIKPLSRYWKGVGVFVTQLETPLPTVRWGLKMAKDQGAITLLNPSPAHSLSAEIFSMTDFLIPNELEAQALAGLKMREGRDLPKIAEKLLTMGVNNVVITLGPKGLFFKNHREEIRMKAFRVKVVDTTAAGDAFLGGFACGLADGKPIREALRFANAAGALATTKLGAQPSLPFRKEVETLVKNH